MDTLFIWLVKLGATRKKSFTCFKRFEYFYFHIIKLLYMSHKIKEISEACVFNLGKSTGLCLQAIISQQIASISYTIYDFTTRPILLVKKIMFKIYSKERRYKIWFWNLELFGGKPKFFAVHACPCTLQNGV